MPQNTPSKTSCLSYNMRPAATGTWQQCNALLRMLLPLAAAASTTASGDWLQGCSTCVSWSQPSAHQCGLPRTAAGPDPQLWLLPSPGLLRHMRQQQEGQRGHQVLLIGTSDFTHAGPGDRELPPPGFSLEHYMIRQDTPLLRVCHQ